MQKSRGFTLVELMIVVAVIAILATLALTGFRTAQASARDTQRQQNVKGVQVALECYFSENGEYPAIVSQWDALNADGLIGFCWGSGAGLDDIPKGDTVAADGGWSRGATSGSYAYTLTDGADAYQIVLIGERKTLTFDSPQ